MAAARGGRSAVVLSSVPLQVLFYLTGLYFAFYCLCTLLMVIYKSQVLSYPDRDLALDLALLFLMAVLEAVRLYWGVRGNLKESQQSVGICLAITLASVLLSIYFLLWQTYVLRADVILNSILLSLYGLQGIVGLITIASFARSAPRHSTGTESTSPAHLSE
ncbi:transmembrane protein 80-like isoform X1 [Lepisosteus oculatus]|uniref:transmembrane protein 80-like isoform X1 n=2 Tax=Lepisosteus oculatus TaxID=7918 RepID=UPI0035F50A96